MTRMVKLNGATPKCGNCAHSIVENGAMLCTLNPPSTAPVIMVGMSPEGPKVNVMGWVSNFPSVDPERKCGQHKRQMIVLEAEKVFPHG